MTSSPAGEPSRLVTFRPAGRALDILDGESVLDCARRGAVPLSSSCSGNGTCRSCLVHVVGGPVPEPTMADRHLLSQKLLADGWRRACQIWPREGCTVFVPVRSSAVHAVRSLEQGDVRIAPDPTVRTWRIRLDGEAQDPARGFDDRLIAAINHGGVARCRTAHPEAVRAAWALARTGQERLLAAVRLGELVNVLPARHRALALAVDLGTTSIGAFLVDLRKGRTSALYQAGLSNPQVTLGADIVTRLNHAVRDAGCLQDLQRLAIDGINQLTATLCRKADVVATDICDVVIAGNSAMQHFLLGLPVDGLARAPFAPVQREAVDLRARDLRLFAAPAAGVHLFPGVAGFVGGDHVAALLALEAQDLRGTVLLLDIGTNTEISLRHEGRILTVSCPSGPALEGGEITWGMQAAPGAIERVAIRDGALELGTIDAAEPEGLCGSGVLDVTAALLKAGILNHRGRLQPGHARVRDTDCSREFVLVDEEERSAPGIVFTQSDVRAVQLAKAAIRSGIDMLLQAAEIGEQAIEHVVVAGAFGSYISMESAIAIGMLPDLPIGRFRQIGGAAGLGVRLAALSHPHRARAAEIAREAQHVGMAGSAAFQRQFVRRINFP